MSGHHSLHHPVEDNTFKWKEHRNWINQIHEIQMVALPEFNNFSHVYQYFISGSRNTMNGSYPNDFAFSFPKMMFLNK